MLNVAHGLVGATIASQPYSPLLTLPAAFISHFFLDILPHWDWGIGFKKRSVFMSFIFSLLDGLTAMGLVYFLFQRNQPFDLVVWLGMFAGMGPDFLEAPATFLDWKKPLPAQKAHLLFHGSEKSFVWGILPQLLVIGLALVTIF